jgi:uncharacterized protein (TIGR02217 family)
MSATFHEVQFPPSISQGAVGGMRFNTSIIALSSGAEHRNVNWSKSRGTWDVKHGLKTQEDIEALIDFFAARNGKAYAFRFKDWGDYRVPRWRDTPGDMFPIPVFFTTNAVTRTFQIVKVYSDAAASYTRVIQKPVAGTLQLLKDGLPWLSGWSVDTTTGIVTITDASVYGASGHVIAGACEFDVPARFDTDDMQVTTTTSEIFAWESIPVVETRDI